MTERRQEGRAKPGTTPPLREDAGPQIAQIHHFPAENQWGHTEKLGLPSISW